MSMPLGKKVLVGYATVEEGGDYRSIAEAMTAAGFRMNHSSARNHFLAVMKSIAEDILSTRGMPITDDDVSALARQPMFQSAIRDIYEELRFDKDEQRSV
jgi:hypothetical protein